jgi:hypothetical protein
MSATDLLRYQRVDQPTIDGNDRKYLHDELQKIQTSMALLVAAAEQTVDLSDTTDGTPAMDGTAARGTSAHAARADHVHPTDTAIATKAPLASPAFTGGGTIDGNAILTNTGAWSTFTPTVTAATGSFTSASAAMRYKQIGKTVHFQATLTITTAGTAATAADLTLPVTANGTGFTFIGREDSATGNLFVARMFTTSTIRIQGTVASPATFPVGNGYVLDFSGTYEAA